MHPQQTRSRTLTVAVTHPGTNAHNCSLNSSSDHTTIYPLGHWYLSKSKWLDTYRFSDSQLRSLCKPERKLHSPKATLCVLYRTKLNKVKVLDRQVFDRGGPSHVQAFLHAVLFPSVRLLVVHPQQTRSRTLTVAVTHPGTNAHNCSLTSSSDHTTIYPLGHWYSSKSKWLDTYRYSDSQLPSLCKPERKLHSPKATLCVL